MPEDSLPLLELSIFDLFVLFVIDYWLVYVLVAQFLVYGVGMERQVRVLVGEDEYIRS